jgi:hypothetical protein
MTNLHKNPLINDALRVIEAIDRAQADSASAVAVDVAEHRRQALTHLVEEVYASDGRTQPLSVIEEAIDMLHKDLVLPVTPPLPKISLSERMSAAVLAVSAQGVKAKKYLVSGWTHPLVQLIGRSAVVCALGAAVLFWMPWITLFKAPFIFAVVHPKIFYALALFLFSSAVTVWIKSDNLPKARFHSGKINEKQIGTIQNVCVSTIIFTFFGTMGGAAGLVNANESTASGYTQENTAALKNDFSQARHALGTGKLDFEAVLNKTNTLLPQDKSTPLDSVTVVDPVKQVMAFTQVMNQHECEQAERTLDRDFVVARINGLAVSTPADLTPLCANIWHNEVTIENKPGTL